MVFVILSWSCSFLAQLTIPVKGLLSCIYARRALGLGKEGCNFQMRSKCAWEIWTVAATFALRGGWRQVVPGKKLVKDTKFLSLLHLCSEVHTGDTVPVSAQGNSTALNSRFNVLNGCVQGSRGNAPWKAVVVSLISLEFRLFNTADVKKGTL